MKSCPILYSELLYKTGQDLSDIQYPKQCTSISNYRGMSLWEKIQSNKTVQNNLLSRTLRTFGPEWDCLQRLSTPSPIISRSLSLQTLQLIFAYSHGTYVLNGYAKICAHVWRNLGYLNRLRLLFRSRAVTNRIFPPERPVYIQSCATCSGLPYHSITMHILY